jgi:hypothetical protein
MTAAAITSNPDQTAMSARGARPGSRSTPMAMRAPTPSCQARVGSEKKAQGAAWSVHQSARPSETATMAAMPMPTRPRPSRRSETMTKSGQNR